MMRASLCVLCVLWMGCKSAAPSEDAAPVARVEERAPGVSVDGGAFGGELARPAAAAVAVEHHGMGGDVEAKQLVVLIHGGPGLSHDYMDNIARRAAQDEVRIVMYDQRGVGRSPAVPASAQTLEGQVADLEALRVELGASELVVVGHSWGSIVAMAYASAHAARVSKLVLVDPLPPTAEGNAAAQRRFAARVAALMEQGVVPAPVKESVTSACERRLLEIMPAYFHDVSHPDTKHLGGSTCDNDVLRAVWTNLGMFDLRPSLKQVSASVWIVAGESDPFGAEAVEETREALAHRAPTVRRLKECGHIPWEECPEPFYAFFEEVLAAR